MRMTDDEKDLEIILLRQQLQIVERNQARGPQIPRWQKVPLAGSTGERQGEQRARSVGGKRAVVQTRHARWLASSHCTAQMDVQTGEKAGMSTPG